MKIINYFLPLIFLISNFVNSQTNQITGNSFNDLSKIFTPSVINVDIKDTYTQNTKYDKLFSKIDSVIFSNPKWLDRYYSKIKDNSQLYFDKRFGLSKEEFEEYLALDKEIKLISSGKDELKVIKNNTSEIISFQCSGKLELMSNLSIDLKNLKIYYKNIDLKYFFEFSYSENDTMLKSKQKGYCWSSVNNEILKNLSVEDSDFYQIYFSISQLETNDRFYITISESYITPGRIICSDVPSFKELSIML